MNVRARVFVEEIIGAAITMGEGAAYNEAEKRPESARALLEFYVEALETFHQQIVASRQTSRRLRSR